MPPWEPLPAADRAAVSVRTQHRLCAATQGTTPAKLIERLRSDHARVLLGTTRMALKEVANRCGFRDGAQLTRSFTRCFGVAPRAYRLLSGPPATTRRALDAREPPIEQALFKNESLP